MKYFFFFILIFVALLACNKKEDQISTPEEPVIPEKKCPGCDFPDTVWRDNQNGPKLIFKIVLDSSQARLNNSGGLATIPVGNAGQVPQMNALSVHYIEIAQTDSTKFGGGTILYQAEETNCGGDKAILFCKTVLCKNGEVFFSLPFNKIPAGAYKWLRIAVGYQNFNIRIKTNSSGALNASIASFIGSKTYVTKYKMQNTVMTPTISGGPGNKSQGYWGFYTNVFGIAVKTEGQAPQTTAVSPNAASTTSSNSGVITGEFFKSSVGASQPIVISGNETQDKIIQVFLSTNKSFEWKELNVDGLFQPDVGETVVDMGLRGMVPKY
jgi:hypothetical protein